MGNYNNLVVFLVYSAVKWDQFCHIDSKDTELEIKKYIGAQALVKISL